MRRIPPATTSRVTASALAMLAAAACHDATGVTPTPVPPPAVTAHLVVRVTAPTSDTINQLGVEFLASMRDSVPMRTLTLYVDSGSTTQQTHAYRFGLYNTESRPSLAGVAFAPSAGRHTFTVVAVDTGGRRTSAAFSRTFTIPDESYAVTALPDAGTGAGVAGLNPNGDVAGWVLGASGHKRPAVWRASGLQLPAVADSTDVVAVRANTSGDVLLQFGAAHVFGAGVSAARVLRADGTLFTLGPRTFAFTPSMNSPVPGGAFPCCDLAADLTESRRAVGATNGGGTGDQSVVFDVARGVVVDSANVRLLAINNAAQGAGGFQGNRDFGYESAFYLRGFGLSLPTAGPAGYRYQDYCVIVHGIGLSNQIPTDVDDAGTLLVSDCGDGVLMPAGGTSLYIDRYVGPGTQVRMARQSGGLIAALDSAGTIVLWHVGTARVTRLRTAQTPWKFDSLAAVNARGQIAVQGVDPTSGRRAALLLTPAAPSSALRR